MLAHIAANTRINAIRIKKCLNKMISKDKQLPGIGCTYICVKCGNHYKMKFMDTEFCLTCTFPLQKKIQKRLGTNIKFR